MQPLTMKTSKVDMEKLSGQLIKDLLIRPRETNKENVKRLEHKDIVEEFKEKGTTIKQSYTDSLTCIEEERDLRCPPEEMLDMIVTDEFDDKEDKAISIKYSISYEHTIQMIEDIPHKDTRNNKNGKKCDKVQEVNTDQVVPENTKVNQETQVKLTIVSKKVKETQEQGNSSSNVIRNNLNMKLIRNRHHVIDIGSISEKHKDQESRYVRKKKILDGNKLEGKGEENFTQPIFFDSQF